MDQIVDQNGPQEEMSERAEGAALRHKPLLLTLLLIGITLALYQPAFNSAFTDYDDPEYLTQNSHVQQGLTLEGVRWAFTTFAVENWHPLTWLSHMADYKMFGLNPVGHHLENVALHAANAALLFWLLLWATGYVGRSFWVAVLFAVHPLNIQSVAWVSERKNLLSTLFGFLALAAYGWYARQPSRRRYLLLVLLFAASLMAKPYLVTLPFALLLLDVWPLRRWDPFGTDSEDRERASSGFAALVIEKIPLLLIACASALVTMKAQGAGGAVRSTVVVPLSERAANIVVSYFVYLRQLVWPTKLAIFYPLLKQLPALEIAAAALSLALITAVAWRQRRRGYPLVGWLWYLGVLVPMIGLVQVGNQAHADRYMYIPMIGLLVPLVWGGAELLAERPHARTYALAAPLLVAALLCAQTRRELLYWSDSITLFTRAASITAPNTDIDDMLGEAYVDAGRNDQAISHFSDAIALNEKDGVAHYNLGRIFDLKGDFPRAIREYELAFAGSAEDASVHASSANNLGVIYLRRGDFVTAERYLDQAIRLRPTDFRSYNARGLARYQQHQLDGAIADFSKSVQVSPNWFGFLNLGIALQDKQQYQPALSAYRNALAIEPTLSEAQTRIAAVRALQANRATAPVGH